ncbi:MAG: hypothetical protein FJ030_00900 [Chloroflexi bacterium]|nr:hypothetical protein [Chloroflexota bacterium]
MLKYNAIANFVGRSWAGLLGLALVPIQIHYLGIEAYGLLGFFASLQAIVALLDIGLSTTANREIAIRLNTPNRAGECRGLVRTLEIFYGAEALVIVVTFLVGAGRLSTDWLNVQNLQSNDVRIVAVIYGITIALRWPISLYMGVLQGAEKQIDANVANVVVATVRNLGAIGIIALVSPTIIAFLITHVIVAVFEVVLMATLAWRALPAATGPTGIFNIQSIRSLWRFSASLGVNSFVAALLKQSDRILIGKLLTLVDVGYYSAATTIYAGLSLFTLPVVSAVFPRLTALFANGNDEELAILFHKTAQVVSFISALVTGMLIFFSYDVLLTWTRSEDVAAHAARVCSMLALASMFNSMMQIPFALQLAAGITWIALLNNTISVIALLPLMYVLISEFGMAGAGMGWVLFNIVYYLLIPHVAHRYVLQREKWRWILADTLPFIIVSCVLFGTAYFTVQALRIQHSLSAVGIIALAGIVYILVFIAMYPSIRSFMFDLSLRNPLFQRLIGCGQFHLTQK